MTHTEEIIQSLKTCTTSGESCRSCYFSNKDCSSGISFHKCWDKLMIEAAKLLKEKVQEIPSLTDQEFESLKAKRPIMKSDMYFCADCKTALAETWDFCPKCGRAVEWE